MKYVWGETTAEERQGWRKRTLKMYYVNTTRNVLARVCCFSAGCRTAGKLLPFPFPFLFQLLHRISSISFMNYSIVLTTLFRLPKTSFDEFSSEQTEKSYSLGIVSNSSPNYNLLSVSSAKGWIIFWTGTLWSKLGSYLGEERNWPHSKHNFSCSSFWNYYTSLLCVSAEVRAFRISSLRNFVPTNFSCVDSFASVSERSVDSGFPWIQLLANGCLIFSFIPAVFISPLLPLLLFPPHFPLSIPTITSHFAFCYNRYEIRVSCVFFAESALLSQIASETRIDETFSAIKKPEITWIRKGPIPICSLQYLELQFIIEEMDEHSYLSVGN